MKSIFFLILSSGYVFGFGLSNAKTNNKTFLVGGEEIYQTKCAFCHNGTVKEAPRLEALQNLSFNRIENALKSGVMKIQGASLSQEEISLVAKFISKIDSDKRTVSLGICNETSVFNHQKNNLKVPNWGMGLNNQRFVPSKHTSINEQNIGRLILKWAFGFPEANCARSQPTIAENTLFTASQQGTIYALDLATGCIRWSFQADSEVRSAISIGFDNNGKANRLYFGDFRANVYALDLITKKLIWKKKVDNFEQATITGSLTLYQNRLYVPVSSTEVVSAYNPKYECCKFRGSLVALDAKNGQEIWKTFTVEEAKPQDKNKIGTQNFGPSGAPIWSSPTIDTKRGLVYVGTGENYSTPTSATSDAIIAFSIKTGKIVWIKQTVSQDAWNGACTMPDGANCPKNHGPDYDFGASPILIQRKNGNDIILAGQKSGMVFAMNPNEKGKIIWQAKVGRGGIMGGIHWGMASNENTLFVPINDREAYPADKDKMAFSGLHSIDVNDGKFLWSNVLENKCGDANWSCGSGISAAITLADGLVYGGSLDGIFRVFSSKTGKILFEFDTKQTYKTVNGLEANGGTIDSAGPVVLGNQVFVNSGYAKFGEKAGNVLLCFELKNEIK